MFNFVCKSFLLYHGRRCTIISRNCSKDSAFPILTKCISTETSSSHSFTVSYLMNSCGFSLKSALSASKRVHFDSAEKSDAVIAFLRSHGFSATQIFKVIRFYPHVLGYRPEKTLLPKLEFYYSKGFSSTEVAKITSVNPVFLMRSLENYIIPALNYLSDLFNSSEKAVAAVKCNPFIFAHDVETYIVPRVNVLREIGVPEQNMFLFFRLWCRSNKTSFGTFRNIVEAVREMGINPLKSQFIVAVIAKEYGRTKWESKVEICRKWGWSEEEFLAALRKNPLFMTASEDKIMKVMDFLVNKMDLESSAIAKRPNLIGLSLEKRFIPRAAVFKFLLSKGLINRKDTNLISLFSSPEKAFLQKYVNSYDEAPQLLKLYQEKLGTSKRTKTFVSSENNAVVVK